MLSGKCKLKQQRGTITHRLECPKSGHRQHRMRQELSLTAGGNATCPATAEDRWLVFYETKHTLTIPPSDHAPWRLPKGAENSRPCLQDLWVSGFHSHRCSTHRDAPDLLSRFILRCGGLSGALKGV